MTKNHSGVEINLRVTVISVISWISQYSYNKKEKEKKSRKVTNIVNVIFSSLHLILYYIDEQQIISASFISRDLRCSTI